MTTETKDWPRENKARAIAKLVKSKTPKGNFSWRNLIDLDDKALRDGELTPQIISYINQQVEKFRPKST